MKRLHFFILSLLIFGAAGHLLAQSEEKVVEKPRAEHWNTNVEVTSDGSNNVPDNDKDNTHKGQEPVFEKRGAGKGVMGAGFVDEDGDGFNDNAPDDDGDGIPNGRDDDYVKPQDGSGAGKGKGRKFAGFIDEDGDGINDRLMDKDGFPGGKGFGWARPEDCLGRGAQLGERFGRGGSYPPNEKGKGRP